VKTWLVDTGPLVAYLDAGDPSHAQVATRLGDFSGALATTSAVITETMHLVAVSRDGPRTLAEFVAASGMAVYDLCRPPELHEAVALMEKYADTPMDFADATLVLLAEGLNVREILTLDRRGFLTYRTRQRRHFQLVLDYTA
jgi:predicted nucleic acid-binding protein